jgi:hypothetical protein
MWLIVDDERELGCEAIARTAQAGIEILGSMPDGFECLCIDHDLGPRSGRLSGEDVIKFGIRANCLPPRVQVVSQNPVGAKRIKNCLADAGYVSKDNINFMKVNQNDS